MSAASTVDLPSSLSPPTTVSPSAMPSMQTGASSWRKLRDLDPAQPHAAGIRARASTECRSASAASPRSSSGPSAPCAGQLRAQRADRRRPSSSRVRSGRRRHAERLVVAPAAGADRAGQRSSAASRAIRAAMPTRPRAQGHQRVPLAAGRQGPVDDLGRHRARRPARTATVRQAWVAVRSFSTRGGGPGPSSWTSSTLPGSLAGKRSGSGVPAYQVRAAISSVPCQSPSARKSSRRAIGAVGGDRVRGVGHGRQPVGHRAVRQADAQGTGRGRRLVHPRGEVVGAVAGR